MGACCYDSALWDAITKNPVITASLSVVKYNKFTCPAKFLLANSAADAGLNTLSAINLSDNWWCSDGSFQTKGAVGDRATKSAVFKTA